MPTWPPPPGLSISVNTLLSQLEREPDESVVDPWVIQRVTLVAEDRGNVLAAAHLVAASGSPRRSGSRAGLPRSVSATPG